MAIKPAYLILAGAGVLISVAGLKGWSVGSTVRDVIAGQNPNTNPTLANQITGSGSTSGGGVAPTGGKIPYLGTTLPPVQTMVRYFGSQADPAFETNISFAGFQVTINKVLAANLTAAGNAIIQAGLQSEIRDVGGFRTSIGGSGSPIPFSMHQFGAAFDINEDGGPNGNWNTMTLDPNLVSILAKFHWFCGENWGGSSRDGGHFQYTGG